MMEKINPLAWAKAVKTEDRDGKPIWVTLADYPWFAQLAHDLVEAYVDAAQTATDLTIRAEIDAAITAPHDPFGSIAEYLASQPRDPSMWATVVESDYDGELCWDCRTEGDRGDGDSLPVIELAADTFPVGTKLEIIEP